MSNVALNTGLHALLTAQYALETLGHNIANANTPGYSRQRLQIATEMPTYVHGLLVGNGVRPESVERVVDALLGRRIVGQAAVAGRLESQLGGLTEIEALLGELDSGGVGSLLDGLFSSLSELSANPEDAILRVGVAQSARSMTAQFNAIANGLGVLTRDTAAELDARVAEVNELAREILTLNQEIGRTESAGAASGVVANDLRDRRERAFEELSRRVDAAWVEESNGAMRVLVAGKTLVGSSRVYELSVAEGASETPQLAIEGASGFVPVRGGTIGGLLNMTGAFVPELSSELDALARNLIFEFNRAHSTGIPSSGSFQSLTGTGEVQDLDQDGVLTDELLSSCGLPFEVQNGVLYVAVNDAETGAVARHALGISKTHTTVGELADALGAIPHLSAELDALGRLSIVADAGYTFDFSPKLDPNPDAAGTFGGAEASIGSPQGPFALSDGDTLDLTVPAGGASFSIAFAASDFANIAEASAEEVAAVVNASPDAQSAGLHAVAVDGRLFVQTLAAGPSASFTLDGGAALGALGLAGVQGTTVAGHASSVDVRVSGAYTGSESGAFTFVPNMDGAIGTTSGLMVDVFDASGNQVASLAVGEGYQPGTELAVAQGVSVSFGLGELSASHGDLCKLDLIADSDTADALVALGMNSFFTGSGAHDIALREDLEADPSGIATSLTGAAGDNGLLLELLGLQDAQVASLGARTFGQFYGDTIGGVGFELASTVDALESNAALVASLDQLRQSVSGVNVDEELVDMVRFEQAFQAASTLIDVVNELQDELMSIL